MSSQNHRDSVVTVGIPVLNGASTLPRTLDSILAQDHHSLRVIVTDNGSSDETREVVEAFAARDSRVEYRFFERGAVEESFARSLHLAESDYFMWAASDDYWMPTFISASLSAIRPHQGFVWPNWWTGDLDTFRGTSSQSHALSYVSHLDTRYRTLSFINTHHRAHKCNIVYSLFRRDFLLRAHEIQDISDDGALGAVIVNSGSGAVLDEILFYKHYSPSADTGSGLRQIWGILSGRRRLSAVHDFRLASITSRERLQRLFPELSIDIETIYDQYEERGNSVFISDSYQRELAKISD